MPILSQFEKLLSVQCVLCRTVESMTHLNDPQQKNEPKMRQSQAILGQIRFSGMVSGCGHSYLRGTEQAEIPKKLFSKTFF